MAEELENVICGYHLGIIRPFENIIIGQYLLHCLMSYGISNQFHRSANGITRFGISQVDIWSGLFPRPPKYEQTSIANFLDDQTAKLDKLIQNKKDQVVRLKELRKITITNAVTKGLNPDAPMKDSGVEWLGQVPEHWDVKRLKRLSVVKRGASPRPIDDMRYFDEDGEFGWVRIEDVTKSNMYLLSTKEKLSDLGSSLSVKLLPNSIFLSIAGSVGKPCINKIKACIHDGFVYFPELGNTDIHFLFYVFICGEAYKGLGKMGTQLNLNTDTVGRIFIGVPNKTEQSFIVNFLDEQTEKIDRLIQNKKNQIEKLQEYRKIVIQNAVTGKWKVCD